MVYVHVCTCMCERDTVGRGYQYVGHTMQAAETGYKEKAIDRGEGSETPDTEEPGTVKSYKNDD